MRFVQLRGVLQMWRELQMRSWPPMQFFADGLQLCGEGVPVPNCRLQVPTGGGTV
jgi:hypothetical protein